MCHYFAQLRPHQWTAIGLYVFTVLISYLYSVFFQPPATYFSNKYNVINQYIVKLGWFWVTVVYGHYLIMAHDIPVRRRTQGAIRYLITTFYWFILTQWLFGPSFIERVFVLTGGGCSDTAIIQQVHCRRQGHQWIGGHDVSGHCVLLIHSSLFLWEEISWLYYSIPALSMLRLRNTGAWRAVIGILGLLVLWWWMLIVTTIYFHGYGELLSGTLLGLLGWAVLNLGLFPRIPALQEPPSA